jgi:uncharacterized protein (TIGR04222 family)
MDGSMPTLSGPLFLALYAAFAAVVIVVTRSLVRSDPAGPWSSAPQVDVDRDPFEVAYLRGDGPELLRFAVFELLLRQALRLVPKPNAKPSAKAAAPKLELFEATGFPVGDGPGTLLAQIVAWCATPRSPDEIFRSILPLAARTIGKASFGDSLVRAGFLRSPEDLRRRWSFVGFGALALAAVAAIRIALSLLAGHHNVGFLAVEFVFGACLLLLIAKPTRLTARGRDYLERLRVALAPSGPSLGDTNGIPASIFVAAAGFAGLAGTPYAPLGTLFPRSASASGDGGSCGSSGGDSGGGDGGGGCGGGCGGG